MVGAAGRRVAASGTNLPIADDPALEGKVLYAQYVFVAANGQDLAPTDVFALVIGQKPKQGPTTGKRSRNSHELARAAVWSALRTRVAKDAPAVAAMRELLLQRHGR